MGAEYQEITLLPMSPRDVATEWTKIHDQALYDHGHAGYSGTFAEVSGVDVRSQLSFPDNESAATYVQDHHEKWEDAIAVRIPTGWYIGAWCSR